MNYSASEILKFKEEKQALKHLLNSEKKYSLLSLALNMPGPEKVRFDLSILFIETIKLLRSKFCDRIIKDEIYLDPRGDFYIALIDMDAYLIKKIAVEIESDQRLLDIDIYDKDFRQISREDLNVAPRTCLICNENARDCMRYIKHELSELIEEIDRIFWERS